MPEPKVPPTWTYLYIERSDDGYTARVAENTAGREVRVYSDPVDRGTLERLLIAENQHPRDVIEAFQEADRNYESGRNEVARHWQELGWRAKRGEASTEDVAAVVRALRDGEAVRRIFLLNILGELGASEHEALIASFLDGANEDSEADFAMRALIDLGLLDKYAETLIHWMRRIEPGERDGLRGWAIAIAGPAILKHPNEKVLRALIDSVRDPDVTPGMRGTAVISLAAALGLGTKDWANRLDDPVFVNQITDRAEELLRQMSDHA